jgi:hypothetical protein
MAKEIYPNSILTAFGIKPSAEGEGLPDFLDDATNVYRTREYIVNQVVTFEEDENGNDFVFSRDTFYVRTKKRDKEYAEWFAQRKNIEGKRFPCHAYSRRYIE